MKTTIRKWSTIVALGLLTTSVAPPRPPLDVDDEARRLERAFTDAWLAGENRPAVELAAIEAFVREHPDAARGHYLAGLGNVWMVLQSNAAPDSRAPEETQARLDLALAALTRAHELDPEDADVSATLAFQLLLRFMLGQATPDQGPLPGTWLTRAREASSGGDEPAAVRVLSLWLDTNRSMSTPAGVAAAMERFEALGYALAEEARPDLWSVFAQVLAARALLFSPQPRPLAASRLTDALLERHPELRAAKHFLRPFVTAHTPLDGGWQDLEWELLAEELEPDGAAPGLADGLAASWARAGEHLWIRVDLVDPPDAERFGINLVVDGDGSQATGSTWWGGGSDFVFDRLVSAWVARDEDGDYRGAVGVTDDVGALNGEMTNLAGAGTAFAVDADEQALFLRVPWHALTAGDSLRALVAVGSNAQWNDNLPDAGNVAIGP